MAADTITVQLVYIENPIEYASKTALSATENSNINLLKPLARLGDGVYLFVALRALDSGDIDTAVLCLEAGLRFETNLLYIRRIRSLLVELYYSRNKLEEILTVTKLQDNADARNALSQSEKLFKARALRDSSMFADSYNLWIEIQKNKPSNVSSYEIEEALLEALAGIDADINAELIQSKLTALLEAPRSTALTQAFERLLVFTKFTPAPLLSQQMLLRVFVGRLDYGTAVALFKNYALTLEQGTIKKPEAEKKEDAGLSAPGESVPESVPGVPAITGKPISTVNSSGSGDVSVPGVSVPGVNAGNAGSFSLPSVPGVNAEPSLESLKTLFEKFTYSTQADLCRAYQYSAPDAAQRFFAMLYEQSERKQVRFLSAYYLGLLARDKNDIAGAISWFGKAEQQAFSQDTENQAVWYQIDLLLDSEPAKALSKLTSILKRTSRPDYFADVVERLSRNALIEKNGAMLTSLDSAVFSYGTGAMKARMAYIAGRSAQIGIITQKHLDVGTEKTSIKNYIEQRLNWTKTQNSELWFKMLAAYKTGSALLPESWKDNEHEQWKTPGTNYTVFSAVEEAGNKIQNIAGGSSDDYQFALFFSQLLYWGLSSRLLDELDNYPFQEIKSIQNMRALADYLYRKGEYNLAIRVITELLRRSDYTMLDFDRKIYWPIAFEDAMQKALASRNLNKWIYYALVRSESLFKPDAVSKSGAIGLGQFMPATAQDMANRLKMDQYDLTKPEDNLLMSAFYFQGLINQFDGQVLPAVWAYNAGPSRYAQWKKQFGFLPFDLFMEAIPFSETRQYGKNIGRSAVLYAGIHEKSDGKALLAYYLGEKTQP